MSADAERAAMAKNADLLAALHLIADITEGSGTVNSLPHLAKIARAAIAKAEGRDGQEPYCPFCKRSHPGGDICMGHHP
jgi:hypothetical protein